MEWKLGLLCGMIMRYSRVIGCGGAWVAAFNHTCRGGLGLAIESNETLDPKTPDWGTTLWLQYALNPKLR